MKEPLDCLVIGAGPAGLTAAIYLARFHLRMRVLDGCQSRAALIPRTHNHAGYPGGISGKEMLARMRAQAGEFGVQVEMAPVDRLTRETDLILAHAGGRTHPARTVLLATGVVNHQPRMAAEDHDTALANGLLRYCPICDGYEVTDQRIGVIGTGARGHAEAMFLRMYSPHVSLVAPDGDHELADNQRSDLQSAGVVIVDGPCQPLKICGSEIVVGTPSGERAFDTVYPALGSTIRSELAVAIGAQANEEGCLVVDSHQRTTVPGLYAAGDVSKGLDQISHAMGEAGVAATTIRNDLAEKSKLLRHSHDTAPRTKGPAMPGQQTPSLTSS